MTLAKGIAGGFPLAGVLGREEIMDSIHDAGTEVHLVSPISCAASLGVFEAFDNENILGNANKQGELMHDHLNSLHKKFDFIGDVRVLDQ